MNEEPTQETLAHLLTMQPMRRLVTLVCVACAYEWVQPVVGRCPRCHGDAQAVGAARVSAVRTV